MQILVVNIDYSKILRGYRVDNLLIQLRDLKHGSVVVAPNGIELEVIEIEGDEVTPLFLIKEDGIRYIGEEQHSE